MERVPIADELPVPEEALGPNALAKGLLGARIGAPFSAAPSALASRLRLCLIISVAAAHKWKSMLGCDFACCVWHRYQGCFHRVGCSSEIY